MTSLSHQLSFLSRHRLSQILDQDNIRGCDWRALVEQMGFTYEMILFLRDKKSPTMSLLEEWEMKEGSGATLDLLIEMVEAIDNIPALEVLKSIREKLSTRRSSPAYISQRHSPIHLTPRQSPSHKSPFDKEIDPINLSVDPPDYDQISRDSSNEQMKDFNERLQEEASLSDQLSMMSISKDGRNSDTIDLEDSILKGRSLSDLDRSLLDGNEFDIFLSFATADSGFAEEMRLRFEHRAGISCYIPSEGLMPGQSFQDEIADKIKRGCRKTVIIMSPDYIDSPWCTYEARLAHHKNPDPRRHVLIPVMYVKCKVPDFISYLFYLDYPRYKDNPDRCERHFWERLYKAVQLPQR